MMFLYTPSIPTEQKKVQSRTTDMALPAAQEIPIHASEILRAPRTLACERLFRIARVLLLAVLLGAPLAFGAVQPWAWGALGIAAALLLALWAGGSLFGKTIRVYWSPIYLPAAAFLVLAAVQYFGGLTLDQAATKEALGKLMTDFLLFFLAGQFLAEASEPQWRKTGLALTLYTFALGVFATLQFLSSHNLIYWIVPSPGYTFGPYVNHNHYAGLMEMLLPLSAAFVLPRLEHHPFRVFLGFALLIPLASLLLSGSRGGLAALLVEVLILGVILSRRAPLGFRRRWATGGALGLVLVTALFFWMDPGWVSKRLETMTGLVHTPEATLGDRMQVSQDSLRIVGDHPWVGVGLGAFETIYPQYQSFPSDHVWDHAHNDYAEALAEMGLIGGLLIVAALALFLTLAFRNAGMGLKTDASWIRLGAVIGCCGLLFHSFADFNLHIPANAAWFVVCAAIATLATGKADSSLEEAIP
jgi:O-antigen ligase